LFSEDQLSQLREKIPIFELVSEYVQLKKSGKNFKGLCPFHQEKTPSFMVNSDRDIFHCFGCGTGGNQYHFLMKIDSLSFPEAVERMAEKAGVPLNFSKGEAPSVSGKARKDLLELHRQAAWYYHCLLLKTDREREVWNYLKGREISEDLVKKFHLGFCPSHDSGLRAHLIKKGFNSELIESASFYRGNREFFNGRILFPIFRQDKKVVGLGGRVFQERDSRPKYLNSPESLLFKKGELFYGLHLAKSEIRKNHRTLVVEGYLDVITLHGQGFAEAIAPLGTALTIFQAKALQRGGADIILLFDQDSAGEAACLRALEVLLMQGVIPYKMELQAGEDPDSFLRKFGRLAFEKQLQEKKNLLQATIDQAAALALEKGSSPEKKGKLAQKVLDLIDKIPDYLVQKLYRRQVANSFDLPEEWMRPGRRKNNLEKYTQTKQQNRWLPEEEIILEVWLKFPTLREEIGRRISAEEFLSEDLIPIVQLFWKRGEENPNATTAAFFDQIPGPWISHFSNLAIRAEGIEDLSVAKKSLDQALVRLKERGLKQELKGLRQNKNHSELNLIFQKVQALSEVLKNKERIYGERKN
jgi:DNA primase